MSKVSLQPLVFALFALLALFVGSVSADGFLAFKDDRPLELTWDELRSGVDVEVCNTSEAELSSLTATLTGYEFKIGDNTAEDTHVLKLPEAPSTLGVSDCKPVGIGTGNGLKPEPGTYAGQLLIFGPGAGSARRDISITIASDETEETAVEGAAGKLAFKNAGDLTIRWEDAAQGVGSEVCNDGNAPLTDVSATFADFDFRSAGSALETGTVLEAPQIPTELEKTVCETVMITAAGDASLDPGTYAGVLVIQARKGDDTTDRVSRKISIDKSLPKSALDKVTLSATRNGPFSKVTQLDDHTIPLQLNSEQNAAAFSLAPDDLVGFVESEGSYGRLYVQELSTSDSGLDLLKLRLDGITEVGTYSGKLYAAGELNPDQALALEITVTDDIWWAIGAISVGIALALGSLYYMEHVRYIWRLNSRRNQLLDNYKAAQEVFTTVIDKELTKQPAYYTYAVDASKIDDYIDSFNNARKAFTKAHRGLFETSNKEFSSLIKLLETAEDDARTFGDQIAADSAFARSLLKLDDKMAGFEKFLLTRYFVPQPPAFAAKAKYLLDGRSDLKVGESTRIKKQADEYSDLIVQWQAMARTVRLYQGWADSLMVKEDSISGSSEPMSYDDSELLQKAAAKVEEAANEILIARNAAMLAKLGTAEDLKFAYSNLAYLGARYDVKAGYRRVATAGAWANKQGIKPKPFDLTPEQVAVIQEGALWSANALVLIVAVLAAFYLALNAQYFDKTFGTPANYLAAITIAFIMPTALAGLYEVVKKFGNPLKSS